MEDREMEDWLRAEEVKVIYEGGETSSKRRRKGKRMVTKMEISEVREKYAKKHLGNWPIKIGSICWVKDSRDLFSYPVEVIEDKEKREEKPKSEEDEEAMKNYRIVNTMLRRGGIFVKKLAELYIIASSENKERIKQIFPDYWAKYAAIVEKEMAHR